MKTEKTLTVLGLLLLIGVLSLNIFLHFFGPSLRVTTVNQTAAISGAGSGLVGYWTFDEGSGSTAGDTSGNGNTGSFSSNPVWTAGKVGTGALNFDGASGVVTVPSSSSINDLPTSGGMTWSAWIYPRTYGKGSTGVIFAKGDPNSSEMKLRLDGSNSTFEFSKLFNGSASLDVRIGGSVSLNQWQHVILTWDGTTAVNSVQMYVNGSVSSGTGTAGVGTPVSDASDPLLIGASKYSQGFFDGYIDDVRVYNRVITSSEAAQIFAYTSGGSNPTPTPTPTLNPPVISSITAGSITTTNATITWTTDTSSDSQVEYGLTSAYGSATALSSTLTTSHSQSLSGLTSNTLYHYRVKSKDASSNLSTSVDNTFTTSASVSSPGTYTLSISKSGTGTGTVSGGSISCGATCSQSSISSGTTITLTASPDSSSTFTSWSGGGCSGTGSCVLTVTGDTAITASFTANTSGVSGGASNSIIPANRSIPWTPGIPGGIPTFPKTGGKIINAKTSYGAVGNGVADDTAAIQSALDSANPGDVVYLQAGTYKITNTIYIAKGIVVRGDGVTTKIEISGAQVGMQIGSRYTSAGSGFNLSGSYTKGATQVTTVSNSGIHAGQYVVIDELNNSTVDTTAGSYLCEDRSGGGYSAGLRCITQIDQVASVSGQTLTLTKPLYSDYDTALNPRVYVVGLVENAGLENVFVERADNVGTQSSHIISLFECAYCWVKNTETHLGRGDHYNIDYTYGSEIDNNFLFMGHNDYGSDAGFASVGVDGGQSLGLSFTGFGYDSGRNYGVHIAWGPDSDNLVENNIVDSTRHALVMEGPGEGNVIAYNYALNGLVYNQIDYNTATASNHGTHPYMNLWEGNDIEGRLSFDYTHGSGADDTVFRNLITHGPLWKDQGNWAIDLDQAQYNHNIVGNILGIQGMNGSVNAIVNGEGIYRLGHSSDGALSSSDPTTATTMFAHGNFDYITHSFSWDPTNSNHSIPASLFLSGKPSFFNSLSWPPYGPDPNNPNVLLNATIPARQCFQNENLGAGGVFDPTSCYGSGSNYVPPPIIPPYIPPTITTPTTPVSQTVSTSGGGGGGGASYPSSLSNSTNNPASLISATSTPNSSPLIPSSLLLLTYGSRGADVTTLQTFLIKYGYLGAGYATGYYGTLTRSAVAKYRASLGTVSTSTTLASSSSFVFTKTMKLTSTGIDVKNLQIFLNNHGFIVYSTGTGSPGHETTYFGKATTNALIRFQEAYASTILTPNGLTKGTGYFGPATIKEVNLLNK